MPAPVPVPDWRSPSAYFHLNDCDRAVLCWEWLRRDPLYQAAAAANHPSGSSAWGLHRFEPPHLPAPVARPFWTCSRFSQVLQAIAHEGAGDQDSFVADRFPFVSTIEGRRCQHLLLTNGFQMIRLDVRGRSVANGPVRLFYRLSGIAGLARPLAVLNRFRLFVSTGRFPPEPRTPTQQLRLILALRTSDALHAGASQREIAAELLHEDAGSLGWRTAFPSLRSQAQRLVRTARAMAAGGYWTLLR